MLNHFPKSGKQGQLQTQQKSPPKKELSSTGPSRKRGIFLRSAKGRKLGRAKEAFSSLPARALGHQG